MRFDSSLRLPIIAAAAAVLGAASLPVALRGPGEWAVSTNATGTNATRHCLADPALLTQWEHRNVQCTRVILSGTAERGDVQYTCPGGGFGNSKVQVITPRSVRIQTQGISNGLPFGYTLHARRLGDCPSVKR